MLNKLIEGFDERRQQQLIALIGRVENLETLSKKEQESVIIESSNNLIGRVDARDGDKIISFHAPLSGNMENTNCPAGSYSLKSIECPADEIWHITSIWWRVISGTYSLTRIYGNIVNNDSVLDVDTSPNSGQYYQKNVNVWMFYQDDIFLRLSGLTAGDDAYFGYAGKIMQW